MDNMPLILIIFLWNKRGNPFGTVVCQAYGLAGGRYIKLCYLAGSLDRRRHQTEQGDFETNGTRPLKLY
ncbi:CDPK-related kinase 3-like [Iris pallida]|uniref:CDPK-related kinase 3-like n=1 Tax=Iris pallida TaxID=29817 RepID=A0AAX6FJ76_IRIPA|nr:CDPK-related kinase 3-like [Iris pallida]